MLEIERSDYVLEEKDSLKKIFDNIDKKESFIFNAGAGSGKTFSLIETLKYICLKYGEIIGRGNQHIICITYTNVAAREIINRLGNNRMVMVSTIHERIWSFIKGYQTELLEIHIDNMNRQISELKSKLSNSKECAEYQKLNEQQKDLFIQRIKNMKNVFYENYDKKAGEFREALLNEMQEFPSLLSNVNNYKKLVGILYKIENYEECIEKIYAGQEEYRTISYSVLNNTDQLHKMKISHETVLNYGLEMVKKYDLLKRVIIDSYPYILIDEYQDTNHVVVEIMQVLLDYSLEIGHPILLGYYGDAMQNIYSDGVGSSLLNSAEKFEIINKRFNRRSFKEIIEVSNRIRKDSISQVSFYEDSEGGKVSFYSGAPDRVYAFIKECAEKYNNTQDNPLHCFLLTNKSVASYTGFEKLYSCMEKSSYYKKNYLQLNTELLSDELSKLGIVPVVLYKIFKIVDMVNDDSAAIPDLISQKIYSGMNVSELKSIVEEIREITGDKLHDIIECLMEKYRTSDNENFKRWLNEIFGNDILNVVGLKNYIINKLYDGELTTDEMTIFDVDIKEFLTWYSYIHKKKNGSVIFHTYHGTKGLEFDNVVIIMEKSFGRDGGFFERYFNYCYKEEEVGTEELDKYNSAKNLLYVSVSRAIKTLDILYVDDIASCEEGVKSIFGNIKVYN